MKNLAGDANCNADIERELLEAGIKVIEETPENKYAEVAWRLIGTLCGWRFTRAWYYWVARTQYNPLPMAAAEELHQELGTEIRVDGHCGCPGPIEWWKEGGRADRYHIDTQQGLNAFAEALKKHIKGD
ncbi:hypothetical protein LCGC14_2896430 [marine sediment metagenome]|uniref:Uncharacterized protein n=1 Tax=marine sediment metagenome TaxID=412755 RepID=A0A0F8XVP5_9ZZZZ